MNKEYADNLDRIFADFQNTVGIENRNPIALEYTCWINSMQMKGLEIVIKDGKHEVINEYK